MARLKSFRAAVDLTRSQLTGEPRRQQLIRLARAAIDEAAAFNRAAIGHDIDRVVIVDGRRGVAIDAVRPGGTVVALFDVHTAAIDFTYETLLKLSPVDESEDADSIVYKDNHRLLVNGQEVGPPPVEIGVDDVVTFVNLLPYARRLERGYSDQAPNGIYEVASAIVKARFGNIVDVRFSYGSFSGAGADAEQRYPMIRLSPKRARR